MKQTIFPRAAARSAGGLLMLAFLLLPACAGRELSVLSYNVCTLFDGRDDGSEYREFDPGTGAWSESLFRKKLSRAAQAVRRSRPGGPDIVFLQEIENERVLEALRRDELADLGYAFAAVCRKPPAPTTVGILSRFPLSRVAVYALPEEKGGPVREMLEAAVTLDGERIVLFNNHWKAKGEGAAATEPARLAAAALLIRRVRSAAAADPPAAVIAAGDFNERDDEFERTGGRYQTALVRLSDAAPEAFSPQSVFLSGRLSECGLAGEKTVFYEPWIPYSGEPRGSYAFKRRWETIDHILFLPGRSGWAVKEFKVVRDPDMLEPGSGRPLDWDKRRPDKGFSDHLPVLLTLVRP